MISGGGEGRASNDEEADKETPVPTPGGAVQNCQEVLMPLTQI